MSRLGIISAFAGAAWRARTLHGASLAAWQDRRARALVDEVRRTSAFYRQHWGTRRTEDWRTLPLVDKAAMMEAFDTFNTRGVTREAAMRVALAAERDRDFRETVDGCTVGLSSGTSGHRGLFLVSEAEQTRWAGTILARAMPDLRPGHRVAFFLRANSRLYERTSQVVHFRFFDLMAPLGETLDALDRFRPQLIVGPPSLLGLLADAKRAGTLHAAPARLISVAEVIEPQDRAAISEAFQAPVGEVYQCTEGLIAVACTAGALHVQEDVMVVQYEPVGAGGEERALPILTDLWRTTQPIIRYRLGDVLHRDATPCRCGSTWQRIAAIEGRQDDLCWFPQADDTLRLIFPDAIRRMILLADDGIREYHADQSAPGALHVMLNMRDDARFAAAATRVRQSVTEALAAYGCLATRIDVSAGVPVPAPGAKRRRIRCTWRDARDTREVVT